MCVCVCVCVLFIFFFFLYCFCFCFLFFVFVFVFCFVLIFGVVLFCSVLFCSVLFCFVPRSHHHIARLTLDFFTKFRRVLNVSQHMSNQVVLGLVVGARGGIAEPFLRSS